MRQIVILELLTLIKLLATSLFLITKWSTRGLSKKHLKAKEMRDRKWSGKCKTLMHASNNKKLRHHSCLQVSTSRRSGERDAVSSTQSKMAN